MQFERLNFTSGNQSLPYCQKVMRFDQKKQPAILLFLHGAGERGNDNGRQLVHGAKQIVKFCDDSGTDAVLLFPQCPGGLMWVKTPWSQPSHTMNAKPTRELAAALELLEAKIKEFNADPKRVYIAGISMGGFGAWEALYRRPDLFAGAFICCGGADLNQLYKILDIPVLLYHGAEDSVVNVSRSRDIVRTTQELGSRKILYEELKRTGHDCWTRAFAKMSEWRWLFDQQK